ncbi:hypothetical protein ACFVWY_26420 [Streptomyces sp. NPDC058195]|uniref:hypothetical protein n=1 Tax=Streptomyces sp. NPDC058195 TaxID=3346375 RepID=UPI0036EE994E
MQHLIRRLHIAVQPHLAEVTLPAFPQPRNTRISLFSVRVKWASLALIPLFAVVSLEERAVQPGTLWALAAACAADRTVLVYQRYCRR